jgi:hypothetical protein
MSVVSAVDITYSSLFVAILQTIINPVGLGYRKSANRNTWQIFFNNGRFSMLPSRILLS